MFNEILSNKSLLIAVVICIVLFIIWFLVKTRRIRAKIRWILLPRRSELVEIVGKRTNGLRKEEERENYVSFIDEDGERQEFTIDTELYPFIKKGSMGIEYKGTHIVALDEFLAREHAETQINDFMDNARDFTVEEALQLDKLNYIREFTGVYILMNQTNGKNYVGQATRILQRLKQHFLGKGGNPNVYFDYKTGDEFNIKIILLSDTNYYNLDDLERDTIAAYDAFTKGYNENKGNGG